MDSAARAHIAKVLQSVLDGDVPARIFEADMYFDRKDPLRPLWFKDRATGDPRENISGCINAQLLFNFEKNGFEGKKSRTFIIIDM